ncbi:unnamed protein product, partial [Rotaria sp. Silwood1]
MDKLCLRSYIKTRWLLGLTATQIHDELTTAYGQGVVSYRTVAHWIHRFSSGRESLEDDPRSGRPIAIITQQNIDAVQGLFYYYSFYAAAMMNEDCDGISLTVNRSFGRLTIDDLNFILNNNQKLESLPDPVMSNVVYRLSLTIQTQ